jgi:hypothetical protein
MVVVERIAVVSATVADDAAVFVNVIEESPARTRSRPWRRPMTAGRLTLNRSSMEHSQKGVRPYRCRSRQYAEGAPRGFVDRLHGCADWGRFRLREEAEAPSRLLRPDETRARVGKP